jgi:hypothetical protein
MPCTPAGRSCTRRRRPRHFQTGSRTDLMSPVSMNCTRNSSHHGCGKPIALTYPPLNAPKGFLAGSGVASFRRCAEAWKLRDEVMARRAPLASILDDAAANMANRVAKEKALRGCNENRCFESRNKSQLGIRRYSLVQLGGNWKLT